MVIFSMENKTCRNCGHDRAWHYDGRCQIKETKQSKGIIGLTRYDVPCACEKFSEIEMTVDEYKNCSHGVIDQERHHRESQLVEWHFCHICGKFLKEFVLLDG